jgi:predicted MFS family arabinose efflux permease
MFLTNRLADRFGGTAVGVGAALAMATGGFVGAIGLLTPIVIAAALGLLNAAGQEIGPFLPLEQVALGANSGGVQRMALYNAIGTGALALGAAAGGTLPYAATFAIYGACGFCIALLYSRASLPKRTAPAGETSTAPRSGAGARLAVLFGIDAFAGGLIVQGFIAYWFITRFHAPGATIGFLLGAANVLSALSLFAAPWLARRFGMLNTMVFTHLPSNILLALIPFAPTLPIAAVLLLARYLLSQMDVPTRQAFVVAIVPERERVHAAAITSAVRPVAAAASPLLSTVAMQMASAGIPFFAAGTIKACYDLTMFLAFRREGRVDENSA